MTTYEDAETGVVFHFDSGLDSGELQIVVRDRLQLEHDRHGVSLTLPVEAILRLVAYHHVAPKRIAAIERAECGELLG